MSHCYRLSFMTVLMILSASSASAAPPSTCAYKFIGTWVYAGGTTVVASGGIAYPKCPMCVATQTWTCSGNTYLFSNSGPPGQFSATLSADGRRLIGSGPVATRVGSAPKPASSTETASPKEKPRVRTATARDSQNSSGCSTITGLPGEDNSAPCPQHNGSVHPPTRTAVNTPPAAGGVAPSRPVAALSLPPCEMCDVLTAAGEILPDLAQKLDHIKPEIINDVEGPLYDGGPNTLHPYLPRRALVPVSQPETPLDTIKEMKDIASNFKDMSDAIDTNKEPEDYAQTCQNSFLDAAWKAFTAKEGSYREKAKAAKDSLKTCWKAALKHIEETVANGGIDPDTFVGEN